MTTIVERDPLHAESLHSALTGSTALDSMEALDEHIRAHPHEHAVVLGPSVPSAEAAMFAQWARIHRPVLGVILVRDRVDSAILAEALRSGMREVVETRDLSEVSHAVRRAHAVAQDMAQTQEPTADEDVARGRLLTVFSTKGGVGKSLVATNLGAALADAGQRVCIVDLDVHMGDVAIMLQLNPLHQLNDLAQFGSALDEGAVESVLTPHSTNLSVLAAPVRIDTPDQASPNVVGKALDLLKGMFDVVVVDTSGIFDDHVLVSLDRTDLLVLVGTLDIPALKSLKLAAGTLDLLDFPRERWRLVLNRADTKVGLSAKEFEETLGVEADVRLPSNREVLTAVNRGVAIVRAHPGNPVSKALKAFAASLMSAPSAQRATTTAPSTAVTVSGPSRKATRGRLRLRKAN